MKNHPYSVSTSRQSIWILLLVVSVVFTIIVLKVILPLVSSILFGSGSVDSSTGLQFSQASSSLKEAWTFVDLVRGSPLLIFFFLTYFVIDHWLWKWPSLISIFNTPNLNGVWDVNLNTSENDAPLKAKLTITQSWSRISVVLDSEISFSSSVNASVSYDGANKARLINCYEANPKPGTECGTMEKHFGTNNIYFILNKDENIESFFGTYYTERDRGSHGDLIFNV